MRPAERIRSAEAGGRRAGRLRRVLVFEPMPDERCAPHIEERQQFTSVKVMARKYRRILALDLDLC